MPYKDKEKHRKYMKEYRLKNKNKLNTYSQEWRESQKDGYNRVYLLEDYNYVGMTEQPIKERFRVHKAKFGRDCTNHRILYKTKSKSDAKELEALLHDMGYEGKHERWS